MLSLLPYVRAYVQCDAPSPQSPSSVCWAQTGPAPSVRDPRQLQGSCLRRPPAASATHPPDRRGREGGAPGHQGPQTGSETATYEGSKQYIYHHYHHHHHNHHHRRLRCHHHHHHEWDGLMYKSKEQRLTPGVAETFPLFPLPAPVSGCKEHSTCFIHSSKT